MGGLRWAWLAFLVDLFSGRYLLDLCRGRGGGVREEPAAAPALSVVPPPQRREKAT